MTSQNFGHTSLNVLSLFCIIFYIVDITEYIKIMKEHIWNYVVNKKVLNIRIRYIFEILQRSHLLL